MRGIDLKKYFEEVELINYNIFTGNLNLNDPIKAQFNDLYDIKFINQSNYSSRIKSYFMKEIIDESLELTNDVLFSSLMFEKITSEYRFNQYHNAIRSTESQKQRHKIENGKNLVLKKYENQYYDLKCLYDYNSNAISNMAFIDLYQKIQDFKYEDYIQEAYEILRGSDDEYSNLFDYFATKYLDNKFNEIEKVDMNWMLLKMSDSLVLENKDMINKINKVVGLNDFSKRIVIKTNEQTVSDEIRGCCIPLKIPEDIQVILYYQNSVKFIFSYLHEIGHAMSFASIDRNSKIEDKYIYNEIMQESYAYLYENLVNCNPNFRSKIGLNFNEEEQLKLRFEELYVLRLLSCKYIFQKEFYGVTEKEEIAERYCIIMREGLKIQVPKITYLIDANIGFPAAQFFIGKIISKKINTIFENAFGMEWFENEKAIQILKKTWKTGSKVTPQNYTDFIKRI